MEHNIPEIKNEVIRKTTYDTRLSISQLLSSLPPKKSCLQSIVGSCRHEKVKGCLLSPVLHELMEAQDCIVRLDHRVGHLG